MIKRKSVKASPALATERVTGQVGVPLSLPLKAIKVTVKIIPASRMTAK
jgi:hypothetical protein